MHLDFYRRLVTLCYKIVVYKPIQMVYYSTMKSFFVQESIKMRPLYTQTYDEFCVCPCCGTEQNSRVEQLVAEVHPDGPADTPVFCSFCNEQFLIAPVIERDGLYAICYG